MDPSSQAASVPRTGARRLIPRWEFDHLRTVGYVRLGGGLALAGCGLLTLACGGSDAKTYGWAAAFLGLAALDLGAGSWELAIARSASRARGTPR